MPRNASINADGFRMYEWPGGDTPLNRKYNAVEPTMVLSVTSIRTLAGEPFQLVTWKINNVVRAAMGTRLVTRIGPRGGVKKVAVKDGPFPGEFVTRMMESRGEESKLDDVRRWLKMVADDPRDVAAVRGSVVHKLIEDNVPMRRVDEERVREYIEGQWKKERRRVKPDVTDEDVSFVINAMRQYWDMRMHVPFVILAQEPQVYNLEAGYAGSTDVLMWFLPEGTSEAETARWQKEADAGRVTIDTIAEVGGRVSVGDWKTSAGVYTNHVVQITAYMGGSFVASDGIIDERLTAILRAAMTGVLLHIRPNKWSADEFDFDPMVMTAFLGSCAFARFLAMNKSPEPLFTRSAAGVAPGTDESTGDDDEQAA